MGAYEFQGAPTVSSVAPGIGSTAGGTGVAVTGRGLTGAFVRFGGVPATSVVGSEGGLLLTATTPAHAAGPVTVAITTTDGAGSLANGFTYVAPPPPTTFSSFLATMFQSAGGGW